ncbi:SMP-30/gluconolactonase/LRE family protein [Nocardia sp. NEAU-G5]|uniref:SMP-30/gluconolactonase/LRE family protein n=1 Tax=Nocardia albiluteola TaxID=2842303 RepID=A0ABS6AXP0_9NOCA|nr:SMP-30/gluconolactonase/LRE family protein [Nocardia albiluteola]MBU3061961.1 SMP-30/gluconolactonase/LRE family protein [Nocardia albiluteola]
MTLAEQITAPVADHGEGPVWHHGWPGLRWVDMLAGDVLELHSRTGEIRRLGVGTVAAALRPRADGGVVIAIERGFALADNDFHTVTPLPELWSDPGIRMNEGSCDPDGRFYCGSMGYDAASGAGALYRLDPDGTTRAVLDGVTISNGLAWSPDGTTAYYVDTPTQCIDAFDYDSESGLSHRRTAVRIPEESGSPDGLTVDADGNIWVALWNGGAVHQYSPTGTLLDIIHLPAAQVTACTFGGPNLNELYITTSRNGLGDNAEPAAGALFRATLGVTGLPTSTYRGPG